MVKDIHKETGTIAIPGGRIWPATIANDDPQDGVIERSRTFGAFKAHSGKYSILAFVGSQKVFL